MREKHTPCFKKKRDLSCVFRGNPALSSYLVAHWIASKMREPSGFFQNHRTHFFAMTVTYF
ncbi:MAG: hypothetical protein A3G71_01565 [Gammaproteobacteria bacterium RIFCSPLOWO2_12_FULL_38_14]|nr:MAG: hypothetical protein A3B69_05570 [Gammaproteobacteria bacterium RIFCSPHIGHO2_02_FULL_38_33]OGT77261.1 MAG: hypothetical protein A3G71_01565 [Gammaproteobacteria bacterium RIFCSPLOWO2_12_FULL_38_14]